MKVTNLHAHLIIEELIRLGVDYFCLAPGSRSTPIVYEVARKKNAHDFIHYDERGLAFHALGYAKATNKPAVIIITSGSALANVFPAVIEAYYSQTPLLILSGDRPFELHDCGSNQAIDQSKFFNKYTLFHSDIPLSDKNIPIPSILSTIDYAYAQSFLGPVHLNLRFREPFLEEIEVLNKGEYLRWKNSKLPHQLFYPQQSEANFSLSSQLPQKGVIILGREVDQKDLPFILKLSQKLNYPIFADILSARSSALLGEVITNYDALIKSKKNPHIDCVLQFGHSFLSKNLLLLLKKEPPLEYIHITQSLKRSDPNHLSAKIINTSAQLFCEKLLLVDFKPNPEWLIEWKEKDRKISTYLNAYFKNNTTLTEPSAIREVFESALENDVFYIASSMPIRDAFFFGKAKCPIQLFCNRGASGTDGNLATAFGISAAVDKPITIVIGDVAFLYDLNSLAQIQEMKHAPTIIVINNSGCGVFKFLPIADKTDIFKRYFQAEHSFSFEGAAIQFGLDYCSPNSLDDYKEFLRIGSNKPRLIEVQTKASENYLLHKHIDDEIEKTLV